LAALKLPFVSELATKYATYTSSNQFTSYRSFFYSALLCSLLLIAYYVFFYWRVFAGDYHKKEPDKYRLFTFIAAYAAWCWEALAAMILLVVWLTCWARSRLSSSK